MLDGGDAYLTPLSDDDLYLAISNLNGEGNFEYEFFGDGIQESLDEGFKAGQKFIDANGDILVIDGYRNSAFEPHKRILRYHYNNEDKIYTVDKDYQLINFIKSI